VEPAAIACLLSESFAELLEDHAVAVSVHDDTPATREAVVHHVRGRNSGFAAESPNYFPGGSDVFLTSRYKIAFY
jgi:hypothetical protein